MKQVVQARTLLLKSLRYAPNIDTIAMDLGVSSSQLRKHFKQLFGQSIYQYYKNYKIDLCMNWLQEEHISIKEATYKIGYNSLSKFSAEFKKYHGVLPKDVTQG